MKKNKGINKLERERRNSDGRQEKSYKKEGRNGRRRKGELRRVNRKRGANVTNEKKRKDEHK